ncbi:hypothetical protein HaLaN_33061, partial [Haematococcus lacustris]
DVWQRHREGHHRLQVEEVCAQKDLLQVAGLPHLRPPLHRLCRRHRGRQALPRLQRPAGLCQGAIHRRPG